MHGSQCITGKLPSGKTFDAKKIDHSPWLRDTVGEIIVEAIVCLKCICRAILDSSAVNVSATNVDI